MNSKQENKRLHIKSRCFKSENDLHQMQDMLMEARLRTNDWHYAHVGELMWNYFMVDCHLHKEEHIRLWYDSDNLIGFAILGEDPSFDFQVLPEYEWRGIETEAVDWAETNLSELRKRDIKQWGGHLVSGARKDNENRDLFLKQNGFIPGGQFSEVNMINSLDREIPKIPVPPGYQIKSLAEISEIANRAEAQRKVWNPWSVGNVSDDDYVRFMRLPAYNRDLDIVAVSSDGVIASYANCWIDPINKIGDFGPLGTVENYRRKGLARAVLLEGLNRLRTYGMNRVCVSTGITNIAARQLYESVGFVIVNEYIEYIKQN